MRTGDVHALPPTSFSRRRSGSLVNPAEKRDPNHTQFGASHHFGTWHDRCVLLQPPQAWWQGHSRGADTVHGTARHPRAQVKDPLCHRLCRQAGGKLGRPAGKKCCQGRAGCAFWHACSERDWEGAGSFFQEPLDFRVTEVEVMCLEGSLKGGRLKGGKSVQVLWLPRGLCFSRRWAGLSWGRSPKGEPLDLCFRHSSGAALPLQRLLSQAWAFGVTAQVEMQTQLHPEL